MQTKYRERLLHLESTFMDTIPNALNSVYIQLFYLIKRAGLQMRGIISFLDVKGK